MSSPRFLSSRSSRGRSRDLRAVSAVILLFAASQAVANGYLFFNERATARLNYVGAVVDTQGKAVADAQVVLTILPINYTVFLTTDDQGLYRSTATASGNRSKIRISAAKTGYRLIKSVNLNPTPAPDHPLAINFILAPR